MIQLKPRYILVIAAIAIAAITSIVSGISTNNRSKKLPPQKFFTDKSINKLITNQMSEFKSTEKFDKAIERFMRYWGIKGASFALMKNDSLIYAKGYGYANIADSIECTTANIFRVASVSKLITAVAIMKLCENGKLNLNSTVFGEEGILNDSLFTHRIRDKKIKNVTVEHLLRHTSGFSNPIGDAAFNQDIVARTIHKPLPLSLDDMVEYASSNRLRARPGTRYDYSNIGYMVLSKIIEKVTNADYETYVKDSILAPIGCYDMYLAQNYPWQFKDNEVTYYEVKEAEEVPAFDGSSKMVMKSLGGNDVRGLSGAGGWIASASELALFVSAINNNPAREDFLSAESISLMTHYSKHSRPIGWASVTAKEWFRSGSMAGTSALIKKQRDGYTWIFISNSSSWNGPYLSKRMSHSISTAISRVKEWPKQNLFDVAI